jgi:hypothetical protein
VAKQPTGSDKKLNGYAPKLTRDMKPLNCISLSLSWIVGNRFQLKNEKVFKWVKLRVSNKLSIVKINSGAGCMAITRRWMRSQTSRTELCSRKGEHKVLLPVTGLADGPLHAVLPPASQWTEQHISPEQEPASSTVRSDPSHNRLFTALHSVL